MTPLTPSPHTHTHHPGGANGAAVSSSLSPLALFFLPSPPTNFALLSIVSKFLPRSHEATLVWCLAAGGLRIRERGEEERSSWLNLKQQGTVTGTVRLENCASVFSRGEPLRLDLKLFAANVANEANSDIKTEEVFKLSTKK